MVVAGVLGLVMGGVRLVLVGLSSTVHLSQVLEHLDDCVGQLQSSSLIL